MRADDPQTIRQLVRDRAIEISSGPIRKELLVDILRTLAPLMNTDSAEVIVEEILQDLHGMGPLQAYLSDPSVSDVMVVGDRGVWIERHGNLEKTPVSLQMTDSERLIERVISPLGLHVDRATPMVDARLPDGSRVNVVIPPIALDGPCMSIRRFTKKNLELSDFAQPEVSALLQEAVTLRRNIVISGGTGSGKTSLLNALSQHISANERIVTIEDTAELHLRRSHVVRLESRPANTEGAGEVTIRQLVKNALRMRPDRIIVGEVRGIEALDMLQAMNTGHSGSMSTCHANSPVDAIHRIETMVLGGGIGLPIEAIRRQILSAIDLIVQVERQDGGPRLVREVVEVADLL